MHHAMPIMIKQGYGRFLNSSSDAFTGLEGYAAYGAANAAVNTLTKAVANDVYVITSYSIHYTKLYEL